MEFVAVPVHFRGLGQLNCCCCSCGRRRHCFYSLKNCSIECRQFESFKQIKFNSKRIFQPIFEGQKNLYSMYLQFFFPSRMHALFGECENVLHSFHRLNWCCFLFCFVWIFYWPYQPFGQRALCIFIALFRCISNSSIDLMLLPLNTNWLLCSFLMVCVRLRACACASEFSVCNAVNSHL